MLYAIRKYTNSISNDIMKTLESSTTSSIPPIITEARWIWPDSPHWDLHNCYALFRYAFDLDKVPSKAPFFITADQSYNLYVNERFVCRGPARGFQSHWPYDEIDLKPFLVTGKNLIAIRAHNPGRSNFQYISQGFAGLLVAAQWGKLKILSGKDWKTIRQPGVSKNSVAMSIQLFDQEHVDSRITVSDWMKFDFDDQTWGNANGGVYNMMPWYSLEQRMIPFLSEREMTAKQVLGVSSGQCAEGYATARDLAYIRFTENRTHRPENLPVEEFEVPASGKNQFRSILLDFGKTVVGNLTIEVDGAEGGEIIDTLHTEVIDPEKLESLLKYPAHSRMAFANRLICRQGKVEHRFYHPIGFRYLTLTVRDSTVPLRVKVRLNWIGYPLDRKGAFQSSDEQLNGIWEVSAWTQQCCMLDAYVDTPWREQAQWWGDARVQAWNTFHLSADARLLKRGIHCIASQTTPNGLTYGHAPTLAHSCILPDFTLIWVLTLWDDYWQTGSLESFRKYQQTIEGALDYFKKQTDSKQKLVGYDNRYWLFLDWTTIFKNGYPTVLNVWLLLALEKLSTLYRLDRNARKSKELENWAKSLRKSLSRLIDKDGLMRDGITFDGVIVEEKSIHSQTLAIMAGFSEKTHGQMIEEVILPYIHGKSEPKAQPSSYWVTYVFTVLQQRGYGKDVIEFIRKKWLPMVPHGSVWEVYEPLKSNGIWSHSHAWSAHPVYHFMQIIGGITQTAPSWKEISFKPEFIGVNNVTTVPTPLGLITSRWEKGDDEISIELSLPKGVKAKIELPGIKTKVVTGKNKWKIVQTNRELVTA